MRTAHYTTCIINFTLLVYAVITLTACASKTAHIDSIPYATQSQALFVEDGIWYRSYPEQNCAQAMSIKVIIPPTQISEIKKDADFYADAAERVSDYCEDKYKQAVSTVKLYVHEPTEINPLKVITLKSETFDWKEVVDNIDDDTVFDDLDFLQRKEGLITAGLIRNGYQHASRACKAYERWFSYFNQYGISPYHLDRLDDSTIHQSVLKQDYLPTEIIQAIKKQDHFPSALLQDDIFQKAFANSFQSLTKKNKREFFKGAKSCYKESELFKGKLDLSLLKDKASKQQCAAFINWMDALPPFDISYAENYQGRLFPYSYIYTEAYFNQAYFPRFFALSQAQRYAFARQVNSCKMDQADSPWAQWQNNNQVKWAIGTRILNDSVLYITPMTEVYPYDWQQEREEKKWRAKDKNFDTAHQAHLAALLYWQYKESMINSLESTINAPGLLDPDAFNEVFNLAQWGYSPRLALLDKIETYDAEHLRKKAKSVLSAFLDKHSELVVGTALEQIFQTLPENHTLQYEQSETITNAKTEDLPSAFLLLNNLLELQENLQNSSDKQSTKDQIASSIQLAIHNILIPLLAIDLSQLPNFGFGLKAIENSKIWLNRFHQRYQHFLFEEKVKLARREVLKNRDSVISKSMTELQFAMDNAKNPEKIETLQTLFVANMDQNSPQGQTLISLLVDRHNVLLISERGQLDEAYLLTQLKYYYSDFELGQLTDDGTFSTDYNAPFPDESTITKLLYRTMEKVWAQSAYTLSIKDDHTFSMPITSRGVFLQVDHIISNLEILSCDVIRHNTYKCYYTLNYAPEFKFQDAALGTTEKKHAWLTKDLELHDSTVKKNAGKNTELHHTFEFTDQGWTSLDMTRFYQNEKLKLLESTVGLSPASKKLKSCLSYKGLRFACK